jgi:hypothetical protein
MIAYVAITFVCVSIFCGHGASALGRVIALVVWLMLSALWLSNAQALGPPTPEPLATITAVPIPTLATDRIRCTTFTPPDGLGKTLTCCALWSGNAFGQGTWAPLGCTR